MTFEDRFDELEKMFLTKSTDYEMMRSKLHDIRQVHEIARILEPAQDNLYASIARGHRKALVHLESGDTSAAKREMAGAVSWFLQRFRRPAQKLTQFRRWQRSCAQLVRLPSRVKS